MPVMAEIEEKYPRSFSSGDDAPYLMQFVRN